MPEAVSPAVPLYAREEGAGDAVLLLHGLGGDHTVWDFEIPDLSKSYRIIAPDLRGHGRSSYPEGARYTFEELEGDVQKLLDDRHVGSAHVVGLSGGGLLALRLLIDDPRHVRSLVLIGAAGHMDNHTRAVGQNWADTLRDEGPEAYAKRLAMDLFAPDWLEAHLDLAVRIANSQKERNLRGVVQWGLAIGSFDVRSRLGRVKTPTLILHGLEDNVVDPSHARLLRQAIPGSEVRLFPNTGHLIPIERPEETTQILLEWFARQSAVPVATA
ncbi:MAG: alpha/beta fold hydrolase [Thermoplasmata archaeon]|nr:alpha/beta fold hydrolase [Thermoplasmata archaeon]